MPHLRKRSDQERRAMFFRINALNLRTNRLPVQVAIIVPSTKLEKKILTPEFNKRVRSEKIFMDKTFGGDTSIKATGGFVLKKRKKDILITEKSVIVESSTTPKIFNAKRKVLADHIVARRTQWKQNSIFFKIEGENFNFPRRKFIAHDPSKRKILVT